MEDDNLKCVCLCFQKEHDAGGKTRSVNYSFSRGKKKQQQQMCRWARSGQAPKNNQQRLGSGASGTELGWKTTRLLLLLYYSEISTPQNRCTEAKVKSLRKKLERLSWSSAVIKRKRAKPDSNDTRRHSIANQKKSYRNTNVRNLSSLTGHTKTKKCSDGGGGGCQRQSVEICALVESAAYICVSAPEKGKLQQLHRRQSMSANEQTDRQTDSSS